MSDEASAPTEGGPKLAKSGSIVGRWELNPDGSTVTFGIKHFWGIMTVRGVFDTVTGKGEVGPDGSFSGSISLDAASVNTKNKQRDKHLRSADFFHAENHPEVTITLDDAVLSPDGRLTGQVQLGAAGHQNPVSLDATVSELEPGKVLLEAEATVDRTLFGMTWSPMGMSAKNATVKVKARFDRVSA